MLGLQLLQLLQLPQLLQSQAAQLMNQRIKTSRIFQASKSGKSLEVSRTKDADFTTCLPKILLKNFASHQQLRYQKDPKRAVSSEEVCIT